MICVCALIVFALASFVFTRFSFFDKPAYTYVSIYIGDKVVYDEEIKNLEDNSVIVYQKTNGSIVVEAVEEINDIENIKDLYPYNIIEIKDKKIMCKESNCPNQVCVNHGILRDDIDNDMIICAPHGMTVIYR